MAFRTNLVPAIEERTVSGSSVSFNSAFALPLKACKVSFSATQAGSGDPSPSNPRAISGVSAIGLTANSTPVSVSLGDTRYGGELDVLTGELIITHVYADSRNYDNTQWGEYTYQGGVGVWSKRDFLPTGANRAPYISNMARQGATSSAGNKIWCGVGGGRLIYWLSILDDLNISIDDFKSWIVSNPLEIVYELATPQVIQLSANELSTILGNNSFSTDTGTLEITFADLQEKSASGSVATFNTALAMPLASCNIAVNAWQEGTGDPSPSNVRPIHGFSEVNATRCGKNLFDVNSITIDNITFPSTGGTDITRSGFIYHLPSGEFTLCGNSNAQTYIYMNIMSRNGDFKSQVRLIGTTAEWRSSNITLDEGDYIIIYRALSGQPLNISAFTDFMIEAGSTATPYEPYVTPTIYTIQLGQEVYGAEVDFVNGVAHVTWIKKVIDETSGVVRASIGTFYLDDFFDIPEDTMSVVCNCYIKGTNRVNVSQVMELNADYSFCCKLGGTVPNRVMIKDTRFNTIEEFNEWVALNPISVLVMLATPFDIQLTPTQIETLIGNNTIFADTGDVDLTYKDLDIAKRGNFREVFKLPS